LEVSCCVAFAIAKEKKRHTIGMPVLFKRFAAGEPFANVCVAHGTLCNDPSVYIATKAKTCGCEFSPRPF